MSSILSLPRSDNTSSWLSFLYACARDVQEFFTGYQATLQKIERLTRDIFSVKKSLDKKEWDTALSLLKNILQQDAAWQNDPASSHPIIQKAYQIFCLRLHVVQQWITPECVSNWLAQTAMAQKTIIARWVLSIPSQRRFAGHYNLEEVPLQYNEIPAGSVLLTDPYAYVTHMQLEKKLPHLKRLILTIKALLCRFFTGKQFTHVEFAMGKGRLFDLDKREDNWMRGEGTIKERGNKVFFGAVIEPHREKMLTAYNAKFPDRPYANFAQLVEQMNVQIEQAIACGAIQLSLYDIVKTIFPGKRPVDYAYTKAWQCGACHYSCSGTTSALFSLFGIDIGRQFKKKDAQVTPTDFYRSHFFTPLFVVEYTQEN